LSVLKRVNCTIGMGYLHRDVKCPKGMYRVALGERTPMQSR
jgi:hypothetical protein